MTTEATIKLGESGAAFVQRNPGLVKTYQSIPHVIQDYTIKWTQRPRGQVHVDHGRYSFKVNDVFSLITDEDLTGQFTREGLFSVDITAGMSVPAPGSISHEQARQKTYEILQDISSLGWQNTTEPSDPRIRGRKRFEFTSRSISNQFVGLDLLYQPNLEEWMRIENGTPWRFYADGLFLEISFQRSPDPAAPETLGVYLLHMNIKSATEYFRGFTGPDRRAQWKEVLPAELAKMAQMRADKEAELRAKGITIDESYQDPPIPTFK